MYNEDITVMSNPQTTFVKLSQYSAVDIVMFTRTCMKICKFKVVRAPVGGDRNMWMIIVLLGDIVLRLVNM